MPESENFIHEKVHVKLEQLNLNVNKNVKVVGIDGCTNGGKTTLAKKLCAMLIDDGHSACFISQDDFFLPKDKVPRIPKKNDQHVLFYHYDCPESVDETGLVSEIKAAMEKYDYVIVEGNMLSQFTQLLPLIHRLLFVTLDRETCRIRREQRTDYDPPDAPGYFDEIVWTEYCNHVEHALALARKDDRITFLNGGEEPTAEHVMADIKFCFSTLLRIQFDPLDVREATKFVSSPSCGAISVFIGTTRDTFDGKKVDRLDYEAYDQMAYQELRKLCQCVRDMYKTVERIAIFHRIGECPVGEESVIIATSSPHRKDAIGATEMAINELKRTVPIWKKEVYGDGSCSWKENIEFKTQVGQMYAPI
uniref:Molybdopterin synthase catalytic subunit n=1 Tax=Acrobeloides nanus TaxID=290746 RepID=A0A914E2L3_9BILA